MHKGFNPCAHGQNDKLNNRNIEKTGVIRWPPTP